MPTDALWAIRVACGIALTGWGLATLGPIIWALAHSPPGHALHAGWFACAMAMALVASGAMLMNHKLVPLAVIFLVPVSMHVLFQWVLLST